MQESNFKARKAKSGVGPKGLFLPGSWVKIGIALLAILLAGTCSQVGGRARFDRGLEGAVRHMGVDLGGRHVAMSQCLLDQQQVACAAQQGRGESVAQSVRSHRLVDVGTLHPYRDQQLDRPSIQPTTLLIQEERRMIARPIKLGPFRSDVGGYHLPCPGRQELDNRAASLPPLDAKVLAIDVIQIQADQLAYPDARVQQQMDDGGIPKGMGCCPIVPQASQKVMFLLVGQVDGWFLGDRRGMDAGGRVVLDRAHFEQPPEEHAQTRSHPAQAVWNAWRAIRLDLPSGQESVEVGSGDILRLDDLRRGEGSQIPLESRDGVRGFPGSSQVGVEVLEGLVPLHGVLPVWWTRRKCARHISPKQALSCSRYCDSYRTVLTYVVDVVALASGTKTAL